MSEIKDEIKKIVADCYWPKYGSAKIGDSSITVEESVETKADQILTYLKSKGYKVDMTIRTEGDINYPYEYKTGDVKIRFATPPARTTYVVLIPEDGD